jgi:hypothetical protein
MFLLPCIFFFGTKFNITSLISFLMGMSEVLLNLVPRKKKRGGRTSAVKEIRLQNYSVLELGGGVDYLTGSGMVAYLSTNWVVGA